MTQADNVTTALGMSLAESAERAPLVSRRPYARLCTYCNQHDETTVLVQIIERNSGPSAGLYACQECQTRRNLRPVG